MMYNIRYFDEQSLVVDDSVISGVGFRFENDSLRQSSKWCGVIHVSSSVGYT